MGGTRLTSSGWRWDREGAADGRKAQGFSARGTTVPDLPVENSPRRVLRALLHSESSFQRKLNTQEKGELRSLVQEKDPENFSGGALNFARRLEWGGKPEQAAEVYGALNDGPYGASTFGARAETLLRNFVDSATDYRTIVPMLAGSLVYHGSRATLYFRLSSSATSSWLTRGLGARLLSGVGAFAVEVPTFTFLHRELAHRGESSFIGDLACATLTLGAMKLSGWGVQGMIRNGGLPLAFRHGGTLAGLLAAQSLETHFGLRPEGNRDANLADVLAAMLSMSVGAHLGRSLLGSRYFGWQNEWDRRANSSALSGQASDAILARPAFAAMGPSGARLNSFQEPLPVRGPLLSKMEGLSGGTMPPASGRPKLLKISSRHLPPWPPPSSRNRLAAQFQAAPAQGGWSEKIIQIALTTPGKQEQFHERLLQAYAGSQNWGSIEQLFTALALRDLFLYDALQSPAGSFDNALLQGLIRMVVADGNESNRQAAFQKIFQKMEGGFSRQDLVALLQSLDDTRDLRVSDEALYPEAFRSRHQTEIHTQWSAYREADIVPLLNIVHQWAPTDRQKASALIRRIGKARRSGTYPTGLIDAVLDYSRRHPLGQIALNRMVQVFAVGDIPAKLKEILDESEPSDTLAEVLALAWEGKDPESIARAVNGSRHTAYLDDMRLARKLVSVVLEVHPLIRDNHPQRKAAFQNLKNRFWTMVFSGKSLSLEDYLSLLELHPHPQAARLREMIEAGQLEVVILSDKAFDAEIARRPHIRNCKNIFFSQAERPWETHRIIMRELPKLNHAAPREQSRLLQEMIYRLSGLLHEGTHYLQISGRDESIRGWQGARPFDFRGIGRQDRLVSEIMALLEEERWYAKNYEIEAWRVSRRLGENLALYFRNSNDHHYYEHVDRKKLDELRESGL